MARGPWGRGRLRTRPCRPGREDGDALWRRPKCRPDLTRGVLGGDHEDAENADGQLGEPQAAEAEERRIEQQAFARLEVVPVAHLGHADDGSEPDGDAKAASSVQTVERTNRSF